MKNHGERAHSKFSASGAERWHMCSGSVALSEGILSEDNIYSLEGTRAHEVLEAVVKGNDTKLHGVPREMASHAKQTAEHIFKVFKQTKHTELMVEEKVSLEFIHPEAFGTLDYAVPEHFGTLHILDYKYGKKLVSPVENLQFIFYALGVAHHFNWNFKRVRMWSLQPRVANFNGFAFWEITMKELMAYVPKFEAAIKRVEKFPDKYVEGAHCFFCPAKLKCPLKQDAKRLKSLEAFGFLQN